MLGFVLELIAEFIGGVIGEFIHRLLRALATLCVMLVSRCDWDTAFARVDGWQPSLSPGCSLAALISVGVFIAGMLLWMVVWTVLTYR